MNKYYLCTAYNIKMITKHKYCDTEYTIKIHSVNDKLLYYLEMYPLIRIILEIINFNFHLQYDAYDGN